MSRIYVSPGPSLLYVSITVNWMSLRCPVLDWIWSYKAGSGPPLLDFPCSRIFHDFQVPQSSTDITIFYILHPGRGGGMYDSLAVSPLIKLDLCRKTSVSAVTKHSDLYPNVRLQVNWWPQMSCLWPKSRVWVFSSFLRLSWLQSQTFTDLGRVNAHSVGAPPRKVNMTMKYTRSNLYKNFTCAAHTVPEQYLPKSWHLGHWPDLSSEVFRWVDIHNLISFYASYDRQQHRALFFSEAPAQSRVKKTRDIILIIGRNNVPLRKFVGVVIAFFESEFIKSFMCMIINPADVTRSDSVMNKLPLQLLRVIF